jgi:hypothetical protein
MTTRHRLDASACSDAAVRRFAKLWRSNLETCI